MRKGLVFLAVVLVVLVGAIALAVANLDSFVDANRQVVEEQVERAVGRPVSFGAVGISWSGGLGVRVAGLRVGEDPAFAKDAPDFLTADAVDVRVNLLAALFGRIEVTRVILRAPRITVIQTADGLSTDSLAGGSPEDSPAKASPEADAAGKPPREFQVSLVDVRDGELTYIDRTAEPPATFEVKELDVQIPSYRSAEPVDLEVSAAVAGATSQNLALKGTVGPLDEDSPPLDLSLELAPLEIGDLLRLSLLPAGMTGSGEVSVTAKAKGTLAALAFTARVDARKAALRYGDAFDKPSGVALGLDVAGTRKGDTFAVSESKLVLDKTVVHVTGSVEDLAAPRVGFTAKSDSVVLQDFGVGDAGDRLGALEAKGQFDFPAAGPRGTLVLTSPEGVYARAPYLKLRLEVGISGDRVTIERFQADAFQGQVVARGRYDLGRSAFQGSAELSQMRVEELLATASEAAAGLISGTLSGKFDVTGAGSGWAEIEPSLAGTGDMRIADGVLGKFNPAGKLFAALGGLPNFSGGSLARFVDSHGRVFGAEKAPFEAMTGRLRLRGGWVQLSNFVLRTADYALRGDGRISLAGALDLKTQMVLSQELSQQLVAASPTFRYLRTSSGSVEIPVALRGTASNVTVVPDISRIASSAGRELITDALSGALGGKSKKDAAPSDSAPSKPEDVGRELFRQGLQGILGGGKR